MYEVRGGKVSGDGREGIREAREGIRSASEVGKYLDVFLGDKITSKCCVEFLGLFRKVVMYLFWRCMSNINYALLLYGFSVMS